MAGSNSVNTNQTARYTIKVAGKEISQSDPKGLESVSVEDHIDMIGVCELTFAGGLGFEWGSVKAGDEVEMNFGGSTYKVFKGYVSGLRHSYQSGRDTLTIMAMDPLCKLVASRKVKYYEEMTDSDIAQQVIQESGAEVGQIDTTTEKRPYTLQRNESNLEFLRRLAARNGFLVRANEGKIDFVKAQFSNAPKEIKKAQLISLDYTFTPRALPPNTTVIGWDYVNKEKVEGTASSGDIQTIGGGTNSTSETPIWQGDNYISDVWIDSQSAAKEVAVGELNRMARNFLRGRAIIQGDGSLHVGVNVKFAEHRPGYNPEAFVLSSRHRVFVGSGHTTEIVFCSNTYPDGGAGGGGGAAGGALAGTPLAGGGGGGGGGGLGGALGGALGGGSGGLGDALGGALGGSGGGLGGALGDLTGGAGDALQGALGDVAGGAGSALEGALGGVGDQLEGALGSAGDALEGALDQAGQSLEGTLQNAGDQLEGALDKAKSGDLHGALDQVKGAGQGVVTGAQQAATGVVNSAKGAAQQAANDVTQVGKDVVDAAASDVKGAAGDVLDDLGLPGKINDKVGEEIDEAVDDGADEVKEELDEVNQKAQQGIEQGAGKVTGAIDEAAGEANEAIEGAVEEAHDAVDDLKKKLGPLGKKIPPRSGGG